MLLFCPSHVLPDTENRKPSCPNLLPPALDGEREGPSPASNLLLHLVDLGNLPAGNLGLEVLELVVALGQRRLHLLADLDALVDVRGHPLEVVLAKATAGHGRGTDAETAGGQGRLVAGDRVLVAGNVDLLQDRLNTSTVKALGAEVEEDHVRVGSISDKLVAELLELGLQSLGVLDDLLLVLLEFGGSGLLEGNSKRGDGVVVGTTLVTREDGEVDGAFEVVQDLLASLGISLANALAEEDHSTAGATEGLVGSRGDNVGVLKGAGDDTSSNETGDVSHVDDEVCADKVCDLAHASIVDKTAVRGCASHKHLGSVHQGILLKLVVVNETSLEVDAVGESLEVGGDRGDP